MESIKVINNRLADKYGKDIDGRPIFRLVFSDEQVENQFGLFEDYHGEILIRRVKELRLVKKYEYIDGKWVLEKLFFGDFIDKPFVKSSYEPIWTFKDEKDGGKITPNWEMTEFIVECYLEGIRKTLNGRMKRNYKAEAKEAFDKDVKNIEEMLGIDEGVHDMKNQTVNYVKPVFVTGYKGE